MEGMSTGGLRTERHVKYLHKAKNGQHVSSGIPQPLGGTSSQSLVQCACQIWQWCLQRGITLSAEHIPGMSNLGADRVSLTLHTSEWKLYPKVCTQLLWPLGPSNVDLFVSWLNNQLGRFISWRRDLFAITTDSFQSSWQAFQGYAHFT